MARAERGWEAVELVGPGSELQLTLDGRAVPHVEVVAGHERRSPGPAERRHHAPGDPAADRA